jgi:hypothetical protein
LRGILELVASDAVLATAACHRVGMVRTNRWPVVAAHLVALGFDGDQVIELAGVTDPASGWEVDQLVPSVLQQIAAPILGIDEAATIVARVLAQGSNPAAEYPITRALADLAPALDYPPGLINQAHAAVEWQGIPADEDFVPFSAQAEQFEDELRELAPLDLPQGLAEALINR